MADNERRATHPERERVAILGLGLMGGSLGMALRRDGWAAEVMGYDAAAGVADQARARGAVDRACATVAEASAGASLVVLAAPVLAMPELLAELAPQLTATTVVTDLGSAKVAIVGWAAERLPDPARFVGGHPMAGREQAGIAAADPALFVGCLWCLTPTDQTALDAVARVERLVEGAGGHPYSVDAARHDTAVASISHLPLLAAAALVATAARGDAWPLAQELAAGGFRDTTRVASGDPRMARDICLSNRAPLLAELDAYLALLADLRARIAASDPAVERFFVETKRARDEWLARRQRPPTSPITG